MQRDNSLLVTIANQREIWYVPPSSSPKDAVTPVVLATPIEATTGIAEVQPDVFYVCTSRNLNKEAGSYLLRLDLRGWSPGKQVTPEQQFEFDPSTKELTGACLIAPTVLLAANCFTSGISRVEKSRRRSGSLTSSWTTSPAATCRTSQVSMRFATSHAWVASNRVRFRRDHGR